MATEKHFLNICHLYPDLLNLYGDKGNIISLQMRLKWRGIESITDEVSIGHAFDPEHYDIVFIGGGQDFEQDILKEDMIKLKKPALRDAIENGTVFLCICGGYQLLGKYYRTHDGKEVECAGLLDHWTEAGKKRLIGNIVFECGFLKDNGQDGRIAGFENHSGRTYLGSGQKPLGKVIKGYGNNGDDGYEGSIYRNVFCSYSHGSLLPKNPALADYILGRALERKYPGSASLIPLDDSLEDLARRKIAFAGLMR